MDIFNRIDNKPGQRAQQKDGKNPTSERVNKRRKNLTDEQIRQKLALRHKDAKVDISKKAKNHPGKTVDDADEIGMHSDVGDNDPSSELTKDKLRKVLESGGFDFNDKERATLEEILYRS